MAWDFPGGPVVKTPRFHCRGHGFDLWLGVKILHAVWHGQKIEKEKKKKHGKTGKLAILTADQYTDRNLGRNK